jgi:hypothetical protein
MTTGRHYVSVKADGLHRRGATVRALSAPDAERTRLDHLERLRTDQQERTGLFLDIFVLTCSQCAGGHCASIPRTVLPGRQTR